jgi:GAF domain-containing protein
MDDPAEQLASRDRLRKQLALAATPAERLRDMARLQETTWEILRRSPEGYAHFLRRNFKARAIPMPKPDAS